MVPKSVVREACVDWLCQEPEMQTVQDLTDRINALLEERGARSLRVAFRPSSLVGGVEPYLVDADTGEDLRIPFKHVDVHTSVDDVPYVECRIMLLAHPCIEGVEDVEA